MSNQILGNDAIQIICESMRGLRGKDASLMAERLAEQFPATKSHIYKLTEHLRPKNKTRSDKGKRSFKLVEGTDVWEAASLVIGGKLDPDQALATCIANGKTNLPTLEYFQKMLREKGLGGKQRKSTKRPFRFWESEFPGELYQIDVTALKVRWEDVKTRRILRIEGVDKNHPNLNDKQIRVWQIMAVDDHSRRRFLRYVATTHINSRDMVEFCCELFDRWGVPKGIYSDNGSEFEGYFRTATPLLNLILVNDGGFVHLQHKPNNAQATGKVENAHKWAEKMDRYVGLAVQKGLKVTIDQLNPFADDACNHYNAVRVHRATGKTPDSRWFSKQIVVRKLPREIIESALLTDKFDARLDESMTVAHKGTLYRIPGQHPFVDFTGQKVSVVVPLNLDLMLIKLPGDEDYREIPKTVATADNAGDFKSHAETEAAKLTVQLKAQFKSDNKKAKEKLKETGEIFRIPHYNAPVEIPETNVKHFPHSETVITPEKIASVTPIPPSILSGKEIGYWEAVATFTNQFSDIDEAKEFLSTVFGDGEVIAETEIETIISNHFTEQKPRLRAVK